MNRRIVFYDRFCEQMLRGGPHIQSTVIFLGDTLTWDSFEFISKLIYITLYFLGAYCFDDDEQIFLWYV